MDYLVTGGGSGLGKGVVKELLDKNHRVFACDIDLSSLVGKESDKLIPINMNITDKESIEKAVKKVASITDGLNGIINCAGVFRTGTMVDAREVDFDLVMDVNLKGMFLVTKEFFHLLHKRKGRVVNIGSEVSRFASGFNGLYGMSKYGVEAYTDALRHELSLLKMKVVLIQPGPVATPLLESNQKLFFQAAERSVYFKPQLKRIGEMVVAEGKSAVEPLVVARVVSRALTASRPKIRYRVNNNRGRAFVSYLPARLAGWLLLRALG